MKLITPLTVFVLMFTSVWGQPDTITETEKLIGARSEVRTSLRHKRKLGRIQRTNTRKDKSIQKYYQRTEGRAIKEIVYDFNQKKFDSATGNPPYEIHELDGVRIIIKNVNPFIYSVDLFELQNDRINNEKLSEASQKVSLKIAISPLSSFRLKREKLSTSEDLIRNLQKKDKSIEAIQDTILKEKDSTKWQQLADQIFNIEQSKFTVLQKSLDTTQTVKKITKEDDAKLKERKIKQLEGTLSFNLDFLDIRVTSINNYINFYNQLLYVVNVPENNYSSIAKSRDKLFQSFGLGYDIDQVAGNYFRELQLFESSLKLILRNCDELIDLNSNNISYEKIRLRIEELSKEIDKFNHQQLIGNMITLYKLVNESNFTLVYETQSISENVDNLRYKIEFKADNSFDLPRSVGNFNMDVSLTILEGLKIDVSPAIIMDFGLVDPAYFFDKTVDVNGDEFVAIRRNGSAGNVSPSIGTILNAYKRSSTNFKFGGSMGFGLSNKLRFRLYLGPSLIVGRQERLVFTAGVAMGLVERLADEFTLNEVVKFPHTTLPNNVPIAADKFKLGGFFSIGFNLSGKQNKSFFEKIKFN
ncbi:MAG: hypothetical protein KIT62_03535 [Cyclobacteriaceae bacterium]|nr:hypothetical protein [Cyclobacteriaceae bacterium]